MFYPPRPWKYYVSEVFLLYREIYLLNYTSDDILCSVAATNNLQIGIITMENKENVLPETNKVIETLTKELESLSNEQLNEFFKFFYKMNHTHSNMMYLDQFEEFLGNFDSNPFKVNEDKKFRKQLIDNVIKYAHDYMSLITAAVLIKKKFNIEELTRNYYASIDVFQGEWY